MSMINRSRQGVILVIDDNTHNIKVMVTSLRKAGYTVIIARNGQMGIERAKYAVPDLILLDILMPGDDGFETCRKLKADPQTKNIPIIFVTALSSIQDKVKGFELGGVDYVTKPIQAEEVLARVDTHLKLRKLAIMEERQRMARALHDSVTQSLYSLTLLTSGWEMMAEQGKFDASQAPAIFAQLGDVAKQALKEARLMIHQLRPSALLELGLVGALSERLLAVEKRAGVETCFEKIGSVPHLRPQTEEQLFYIAQEALNNALRHADASQLIVRLERTSDSLILKVQDNGSGFEPTLPSAGIGLKNMQERAEMIGGQLTITSKPNHGTTVLLILERRRTWQQPPYES